jgi:hypothetical protein
LGLAPRSEAERLWTHQLQLTIADFVVEIHDTHHPISSRLYFEDQRTEAKRRSADFLKYRPPKAICSLPPSSCHGRNSSSATRSMAFVPGNPGLGASYSGQSTVVLTIRSYD